jgi:hypothetical protein
VKSATNKPLANRNVRPSARLVSQIWRLQVWRLRSLARRLAIVSMFCVSVSLLALVLAPAPEHATAAPASAAARVVKPAVEEVTPTAAQRMQDSAHAVPPPVARLITPPKRVESARGVLGPHLPGASHQVPQAAQHPSQTADAPSNTDAPPFRRDAFSHSKP